MAISGVLLLSRSLALLNNASSLVVALARLLQCPLSCFVVCLCVCI